MTSACTGMTSDPPVTGGGGRGPSCSHFRLISTQHLQAPGRARLRVLGPSLHVWTLLAPQDSQDPLLPQVYLWLWWIGCLWFFFLWLFLVLKRDVTVD